MLVALSFAWGLTWPAMRIALDEIPPFSMRVVTLGLGGGALMLYAKLQGRALATGNGKNRVHLVVSSDLNVLSFSLLSVIAMMFAATGRVAMLAYTMPIWAALFAWGLLGERLLRIHIIALALCLAGMTILIWPLAQTTSLIGLLIAMGIAVSWAAGTVYVKYVRMSGDPVANAAWQVVIAFGIVVVLLPVFEGELHLAQAHLKRSSAAAIFAGWSAPASPTFCGSDHRPRVGDDGLARRAECAGDRRGLHRAAARGNSDALRHHRYVLIFAASVCVLAAGRR
jgi:drug/metabolite transporter (DMT)-like permease